MWELSRGPRVLAKEEILERANQDLASQQLVSLSGTELEAVLEALHELKCIQAEASPPRTWTVVEYIEYEYR